MTEPAQITGVPTIRIGGKDWPVPALAVRQLRTVRRPLIDLSARISAAIAQGGDGALPAASNLLFSLTSEDYQAQVLEVVYQGLTRAHPGLTREEFDDMSVADDDLMAAWFVVRRQSGLFVLPKGEEDKPAGEAPGTQAPSSTGIG